MTLKNAVHDIPSCHIAIGFTYHTTPMQTDAKPNTWTHHHSFADT